jgi:hypothetical protein
MVINSPMQTLSREKPTLVLFVASLAFVALSLITCLVIGSSMPMVAIAFAACLFGILPVMGIIDIQKKKSPEPEFILNRHKSLLGVKTAGVLFGMLMIFFIIGGALASYEIYELDIPGGILILIAGLLALAGSALYRPAFIPPPPIPTMNMPPPPPNTSQTNGKEIIYEKEVIIKMRCQYCGFTFDEKLDKCPTCGAKR